MKVILTVIVAAAAMLSSCNSQSGHDKISRAEEAYENGDYAEARNLCDDALADSTMSAKDAAHVSLLFIKVADKLPDDDGEAVGQAVKAYDLAVKQNADSANHYFANVDEEDTRHVKMLLNVVKGLAMPDSSFIEEDETMDVH